MFWPAELTPVNINSHGLYRPQKTKNLIFIALDMRVFGLTLIIHLPG